jgi:hypothetical protein
MYDLWAAAPAILIIPPNTFSANTPSDEVIVKVQRRLFPRGEPATICDQSKTLVQTTLLTEAMALQMGGATVGYFRARRRGDIWQLGLMAPKQSW